MLTQLKPQLAKLIKPTKLHFYNPKIGSKIIPLFGYKVSAGFPSPADDHLEKDLDLNDLLISKPNSTYFVRVEGYSMTGAGITDGDILVVDRSLEPRNNDIIIATLDNELTVKKYCFKKQQLWLMPENPKYKAILISEDTDFSIFGVVTSVIHQFRT